MNDERGSASLLVVAFCGVVLLLGLAAAFLTASAAAHRRAQSAADLAALAGAVSLSEGRDPCAAAADLAARNGAEVTACSLIGADVVVAVGLDGPELIGHSWRMQGRARAGPG